VTSPTSVVVVTGMSGAGKSTALHALEDLGFFCVDNLPPAVLPSTIEALEQGNLRRLAFGIDVRVRRLLDDIGRVMDAIVEPGRALSALFLDASDAALFRRFSSTRRPHPLATQERESGAESASDVLEAIRLERGRLAPLRARSTLILDTTTLSVHDLRRAVFDAFGTSAGGAPRMRTRLVSFGFKYGAPLDADLVFDVRFLENPFFVPELKALPGTDARVRDYVLEREESRELLQKMADLLAFSIPRFEREGKSYLTIAVGCTGGRHRSVAIALELAQSLSAELARDIDVVHRDVEKVKLEEPEAGGGAGA
jgi:UPF0042 nucleotide-binding protein